MSSATTDQSFISERARRQTAERQQHVDSARGVVAGILLSLPVWGLIGVAISAVVL